MRENKKLKEEIDKLSVGLQNLTSTNKHEFGSDTYTATHDIEHIYIAATTASSGGGRVQAAADGIVYREQSDSSRTHMYLHFYMRKGQTTQISVSGAEIDARYAIYD